MKFCNTCQGFSLNRQGLKDFIKILSPFAPHIAEELWQINKFEGLCCSAEWPEADKKALKSEKTAIIIQINGKVRDVMEAGIGLKEEEIKKTALSREKVKKWIQGKQIKKTVFVPEKLINFIV